MDPLEQQINEVLEPVLNAGQEDDAAPLNGAGRILLVAAKPPRELARNIESLGHTCVCVDRIDAAVALAQADNYELLLLDPLAAKNAAELLHAVNDRGRVAKIVMFSEHPDAQTLMHAMRLGAIDFFHTPLQQCELRERLDAALTRTRVEQRRDNRLIRLKAICSELNEARRDIAEQLDNLSREVVNAYEGMSEQMNEVAMASEFRTLLRQELDIEDLLRTALEYALTKTGPTNAAVFLTEGGSDFSLGAYVNYDCPRETIAEVLDRLGSAICPQMANEKEIVTFQDAREFAQWLDIEAGMLAESEVIAFSCAHESETLAVIVLFRSKTKPFDHALPGVIDTLRPIFAAQLANVMRIHHRAMPAWPNEARGEQDEYDFDDPTGYGFGPLAA